MLYFIFSCVTPACVWCCDASTFIEHENHRTSNLNMKYSGEPNKRQCPDHSQTFVANRQRSQARATPPMSTASSPDQSRRRTPSAFQTTVSYGIILSHGHKSTATFAKQQFNTSILYITKLQFIGSRQELCSPKQELRPRCQLLHHQAKAVKEPPSPLQTTVSYSIRLSHGHKSTATFAKQQFNTSILYIIKLQFIGSRQELCLPKQELRPRCQLLHYQTKAVKEPPPPLQTTVSYGITLSHRHKSTATFAKQ